MGFELGRTYSMYEFLDVLRTSRSTAAYRVRNTLARREELLQVLLESAQDDQEQVERFIREVRVRACLAHANIVTFYNAFVLEGRLVMTTELVDGPTVAERLEAGPLEWPEAVGIARQALSALAYAHEQNVVHRDISPHNIVLANGVAKLVNFALAKSVYSPQLTQAGAIVGNPRYISPEQVRGTGELDARSDIYSLGAVLYEMLCGVAPFDSKSQFEMMLAHVNGAVKPPSEVNAGLPAELDAVVSKALAKHQAERYQTAGEFAAALPQDLPAQCGAGPRPAAASQAASDSAPSPRLALAPPPELALLPPPEPSAEPEPELMLAPPPNPQSNRQRHSRRNRSRSLRSYRHPNPRSHRYPNPGANRQRHSRRSRSREPAFAPLPESAWEPLPALAAESQPEPAFAPPPEPPFAPLPESAVRTASGTHGGVAAGACV